jgi:oxaloacetate decarboxylase alpha subunit
MNLQEIKELIKIIDETEISEFKLESEGVKVSIRKEPSVLAGIPDTAVVHPERQPVIVQQTGQSAIGIKAPVYKTPEPDLLANTGMITSPMVGTFYSTPSPEAPAFVRVGEHIKVGQLVCIIEAMKLMNEIESEIEGKLIKILAENGQPVEYGQPLFLIEKG